MIETIDYALQFAVLLLLCIYGARLAVRAGDRGWLLLAFFYACYALGDLYWLLCLLLEGATPRVFYVSELSWYAGYIFLCLLLRDVQERSAPQKTRLAVLAPLFAAAFFSMAFFTSRTMMTAMKMSVERAFISGDTFLLVME